MRNELSASNGFTLIELLVAVGLMMLIMGIVAMIFSQGSSTYRDTQERLLIYDSASFALNTLDTDLKGCLPIEEGKQVFSLSEDKSGADTEEAKDKISFVATVPLNGESRTGSVAYRLEPDTDLSLLSQDGKPVNETVRTKRPLYVLRREVYELGTDTLLSKLDLCHYVLSLNIEYYDTASKKFRQISDSSEPKDKFKWPIGDKDPEGEVLHSGLRVTIIVVASGGEHQERVIPKVIWLPLGQ
ncbi:MAG: prepilin-type N-terminal cleavage/methylation domain-containing protein [Planctomycetes bacterium]|nr:prepilin-type N-terminal cleavage/methylation domain-containing protein [Planctomycetota bacterium]